jgi:GTP-binding protein LepA
MDALSHIRNFCIIAHIDHGKSTLADRILQLTRSVEDRDFRDQMLDAMDLERERGITIKSHPVTMNYTARDGKVYQFNLIDTPGHVDFTYEVSRSMAACEGALLLIDTAQGVQAQTVANTYLAIEHGLEIIPVLNKVDLPSADVPGTCRQVEEALAIPMDHAAHVSAKTGLGVPDLLEMIVARIPPPKPRVPDGPLRAIVFDSVYDVYRGVVTYVRVIDGTLRAGDSIRFMGSGIETQVKEVGVFSPQMTPNAVLGTGQVGYVVGTIKEPREIRIGDTVTTRLNPAKEALPGFKDIHPMVFSGLYPLSTDEYDKVRQSLEKLQLNDSAFTFHPESSVALGFGFRCGFLGLLHLEIVTERLEREFGLDLISTAPSVTYEVTTDDKKTYTVTNPSEFPSGTKISSVSEPMVKAAILAPKDYVGTIMELCQQRRGTLLGMEYLGEDRVEIRYTIPLGEIVFDFFDNLKSKTAGYASLDYEPSGDQEADLVKVDILLQGEAVDAFSAIVHRDKAYAYGVLMTERLKKLIPRQQFEVPIQAAIGARIIARESIRAMRKDVLAKCYGGDISRKRKLLEKQKEGKKRMKMVGRVEVPQEAFIAALSGDTETKAK